MKLHNDEKVISINKYNQKTSNKVCLINPYGFGDTILVCGFKEAIKKYYNLDVHFIIKPEHEIIMKLYDIDDYSFRYFDETELRKIESGNSKIKAGQGFIAHPGFINDKKKLLNSFCNYEISMEELFRKTLGLPDDAIFKPPLNSPQFSQELQRKIKNLATLDRIVVFSPEAFSTKRINRPYLENIVKELTEQGFVVISSVSNKKETIKGSIYIDLSFEEALALAINCSSVFAVRSGFVDALIQYRKNMTVIYPDFDTHKIYSLKKSSNEITEIIASGSSTKKISPVFQVEDKGNERIHRFCLTLLRTKEKRDEIKDCILGIPVCLIKRMGAYKKYYLFGFMPVFEEAI